MSGAFATDPVLTIIYMAYTLARKALINDDYSHANNGNIYRKWWNPLLKLKKNTMVVYSTSQKSWRVLWWTATTT